MRVLILSLHFAPDTVSNAVVVTDLAEEIAKRGHRVTVVSAMPYHQGHRIEPMYRGRLWQRGRHGAIDVVRSWLLLRGGKREVGMRFLAYGTFNLTSTLAALALGPHDVVITPSPPLTIGISGWILARLWGARFVYNVQDIYPDAAVKLGLLRNSHAIRFFKSLESFVYTRADAVTVLSEGFRLNLLAKGVADEKVHVIPNPVDTAFIRPLEKDNRFAQEHDLVGRRVALYAGNVGLAQGLETLVDATAYLRDARGLVLIVGAGAALESLRARAQKLSPNRVRFLPFLPRGAVPSMYGAADVGCVVLRPGMGDSSVPSKVYSVMAAGRPVLASVDPGTEVWRLIERTQCGVCVPPGDPVLLAAALDGLWADRAGGRKLGQRGRAHVEAHNSRRLIGDQYHALVTALRSQAR